MDDLRTLLGNASRGDAQAVARVCAELYPELHAMAHARLRKSGDFTLLDTTALVHDSFLRLSRGGSLEVGDRVGFLAYASRVMRSIVIDLARERAAQRHGGDVLHVTLNTAVAESVAMASDHLLRVHDALADLEKIEPRLARIVEMRFFGGLTDEEIAQNLDITDRTVRRDWQKAKVLLGAVLG